MAKISVKQFNRNSIHENSIFNRCMHIHTYIHIFRNMIELKSKLETESGGGRKDERKKSDRRKSERQKSCHAVKSDDGIRLVIFFCELLINLVQNC